MDDDDDLMLNISSPQQFSSYAPTKSDEKSVSKPKKKSSKPRTKNRPDDQPASSHKKGITSCLFTHNPEVPNLSEYSKPAKGPSKSEQVLFSAEEFKDLPIAKEIVGNIKNALKSEKLTKVQKLAIPPLLEGKDVLVKSATGSGKTLTYAIPVVEKLRSKLPKVDRSDGPYAIVMLPTRELAQQTYDVFQGLCCSGVWVIPGVLLGGEKKKSEKARIRKGINILIATPGRLLDHIKTTKSLNLTHVEMLILDEADRLLDLGFKEALTEIIRSITDRSQCPRQSILLSATLDPRVDDLANVCTSNHVFIDATASTVNATSTSTSPTAEIDTDAKQVTSSASTTTPSLATPSTLKQHFIVVPAKQRLVALHAFLIQALSGTNAMKIIVFTSSRAFVDFLFSSLESTLMPLLQGESAVAMHQLHGSMKQVKRQEALRGIKQKERSLLICTDVAARGLDLPNVNWIVQFTPACDIDEYLHRVGRTARIGQLGESLLFLLPSEVPYLDLLKERKARLSEMNKETVFKAVSTKVGKRLNQADVEEALSAIQQKYEEHVSAQPQITQLAKDAFVSFIEAYTSYPSNMKSIFHVKKLHLGHIAKSFGLRETPTLLGKHKQADKRHAHHKKQDPTSSQSVKRHKQNIIDEHDSCMDTRGPVPKKQRKKFK